MPKRAIREDELGWRKDKPIPYEENEAIPLGSGTNPNLRSNAANRFHTQDTVVCR